MGGVISAIFGGDDGSKALKQQIAQQQAQQTSDQGMQLASLSKAQASSDNETAGLSKPGLGRALLSYNKDQGGGSATLGG